MTFSHDAGGMRLVPETVETLQQIIVLNYDAFAAYDLAAEQVDDPALKNLLNGISSRRRTRAEHLNALIGAAGFDKVDADGLDPAASEWSDLLAAAERGAEDLLVDEAERGESMLRQAYAHAIVVTSAASALSPVLNKQYGSLLKEWLVLSKKLARPALAIA